MGRVSPRGWQKCAGIIPLPTVGYGKNLLRGESERELLPRGQGASNDTLVNKQMTISTKNKDFTFPYSFSIGSRTIAFNFTVNEEMG